MSYEIVKKGYFKYIPEKGDPPINMLMGYKRNKQGEGYIVEDNVVNRLVLNIPLCFDALPMDLLYKNNKLKEYQNDDIQDMLRIGNCLNANPMGLGKTVETIELLECVNATKSVIIVPKGIKFQWLLQFDEWWPQAKVSIYESGQPIPCDRIWIVHYEQLLNDRTMNELKAARWDYVVVDEAHRIKNRNSERTKRVKLITSTKRIALTGTPVLRYVDDLWSILNFLDVSYSGRSYWTFVEYFCKVDRTPWGNQIAGLTDVPDRIDVLNILLETVSIRNNISVTKGRTTDTIKLDMYKEQAEVYKSAKKLLLDSLPENMTIVNGMTLLLRLRQLTSNPHGFIEDKTNPKFEWIRDILNDNPDEKIVVFSTFAETLKELVAYLSPIKCVLNIGELKSQQIEHNRKLFLKDPSVRVIAGTIGAMGQGIDGLQNVSHIVVFIDRDWSPEIMAQCEMRLDRIGQKQLVNVYYLECNKTVDEYVTKVNITKAEDIRRILNDKDSSI